MRPRTISRRPPATGRPVLTRERVGHLLGAWQQREVMLATRFAECKVLSREQIEDVYQQCALEMLEDTFETDEHVRNVLHAAIRNQALRLIRDESRRREILREHADELRADVRPATGPDEAVVSREDRMIVSEFLSELSTLEQRTFWLAAEGKGYRAIATALSIEERQARNATRSCERKRQTFQWLYETGRLCGYRAETLRALQAGEQTSEELAMRAFLHWSHCGHCRAEHQVRAADLRRHFNGQVAALLPPILAARLGWLGRAVLRGRALAGRFGGGGLIGGGLRQRAATLLVGGSTAGKLAAGALSVAVIAGGAVGATQALQPPHAARHHRPAPVAAPARLTPSVSPAGPTLSSPAPAPGRPRRARLRSQPGSPARAPRRGSRTPVRPVSQPQQPEGSGREPEGFAYLGVPARGEGEPAPPRGQQTEGGAFSP